jgi:hypothetical protein
MRPKTKGLLAQHGDPPGWLEESDQAELEFLYNLWGLGDE